MKSWFGSIAFVFFCLLCGDWAHASQRFALLVGVEQPDNFARISALTGVKTDVQLMQELARRWGVAPNHLYQLGSWLPEEERPSKAALDASFARLANAVNPGDEVLLYFSGHGTQQPLRADSPTNLGDNLEEVFLLQDSTPWMPETGTIGNAMSSNDLRQYLNTLGQKGVFIWLVVDACHAAMVNRGGLDIANEPLETEWDVVASKSVTPAMLGVKFDKAALADQTQQKIVALGKGLGLRFFPGLAYRKWPEDSQLPPMLAFYATERSRQAVEVKLRTNGVRVGLFTLMVTRSFTQTLATAKTQTYQDLVGAILQAYRQHNISVAPPIFQGNEWKRKLSNPVQPHKSTAQP